MNQYGESFAKFYDRHFGGYAEELAPRLLRFFASRSSLKPDSRILDLGCGTGRLAYHFLEAGYSVTGLDLSPSMLQLAETRCRQHVLKGKAQFIEADISGFHLDGFFNLALSTYNSMNHLENQDHLRSCFHSVKKSLLPRGLFFFDYHTLTGLKEWASNEEGQWAKEKITIRGNYDSALGRAIMRLQGVIEGRNFEEEIINQSLPLVKLESYLREEGFSRVQFLDLGDFSVCVHPENETRVGVLAD